MLNQSREEESFWNQLSDVEKHTITMERQRIAKTEEQRIAKALNAKIALKFDKTPLSEVARHIATQAGINVVVDNLGLTDEGVTPDEKITIDVKDVTLGSALGLILKPLRLGYFVQDEVLKITSQTRMQGPLEVRTYPVADLVVPMPQRVSLDMRKKPAKFDPPNPKMVEKVTRADCDNLIELIATTVEPDSWAEKGGSGSMRSYETTLSLVIRQTQKVHEEIHELLDQLRRLQDIQVCLELRTIEAEKLADPAIMEKLHLCRRVLLDPQKTTALIQSVEKDKTAKLSQLPTATLFNGQTLNLLLPEFDKDGATMEFSPVSSADRRFVRLSINGKADAKQVLDSLHTLKDGHSELLDVSKLTKGESKQSKLLLVTPRIVVQEEEEELLRTAK